MSTEDLLAERGKTHGEYWDHAEFTQNLKEHFRSYPNWGKLVAVQRESLDMFAHKMGRILTGNPNVQDHWDDIAGYSRLVSQRMDRILSLHADVKEKLAAVDKVIQQPPAIRETQRYTWVAPEPPTAPPAVAEPAPAPVPPPVAVEPSEAAAGFTAGVALQPVALTVTRADGTQETVIAQPQTVPAEEVPVVPRPSWVR